MTQTINYIPTGIAEVPQIVQGIHICYFFKDKEGLSNVILPFVKTGLRCNEKCIIVTSDPINSNEMRTEFNKTGMRIDDYLNSGQLLIVEHESWYTNHGEYNIDDVLNRWSEAEKQALYEGYTRLRAVGILSWISPKEWSLFVDYETIVDSFIKKQKMIALCCYAINKISTSEVVEVVSNHSLALVHRNGDLLAVGNSKLAKICTMRGNGYSYASMGSKMGISRQRTHQILKGLKKRRKDSLKMLSSTDVASLLNIHVNTVRRWSNQGILPVYRFGSRGDRRFKQDDIDKLVEIKAPYNI
jgi:excisionase family DNA binding protein